MDLHGVCDGLQRAVARTVLVHQVEPCNLIGKLLSMSVSSNKLVPLFDKMIGGSTEQ